MEKLFVNFLPPWVETNIQPAFYDKESGSVLQQTARMYAKVNCLVRMFNKLSKETKETVEDYIARFVELKDFVDTYFENLDVQEEINNKLDQMAEDGTLQEIIGAYLNSTAVWGFDTVADMKASTNLIDGSFARTLGYHVKDDGGGALYKIRNITNDDVIDEKLIIAMNDAANNLVAELITGKELNIKKIGAYGDDTHDDTTTLQYAFDKAADYTIIIPKGTYKTTSQLTISADYANIFGEDADINYTGNEYAIKSTYLRYSTIKIGKITASNGGCIRFEVTSSSNKFVYDDIYFKAFSASTNCVYASCTGGGWINEIRWFNGKLLAGDYGFRIDHDFTGQWASNAINGWHFNNIGVEGVTTGFWLNAISGKIVQLDFNGLRNAESFTTLLKTTGSVARCAFYGANEILDTWLDLSSSTNNISIYGTISINGTLYQDGYIMGGKLIGNLNNNVTLQTSIDLVSNTDLNDLTIPGTFSSNNNTITQSLSNKPTGVNSGVLKVINFYLQNKPFGGVSPDTSGYMLQYLFCVGYDFIYFRKCEINSSGTPTWGSWRKLDSSVVA